jgi:RNA exonuclease 1
MRKWGYIIDMPNIPGGTKPSLVGHIMTCERCSQPYMVKSKEQAEECLYHYGKQFTRNVNGKRSERRLSQRLG